MHKIIAFLACLFLFGTAYADTRTRAIELEVAKSVRTPAFVERVLDEYGLTGMPRQVLREHMQELYKNDEVIAKSKKLDFFTSNVNIFDVSGKFVANFDQRAFTLSDKWNCKIENTEIDKRLIIFIPSFVSAAQSDKREKEGEK